MVGKYQRIESENETLKQTNKLYFLFFAISIGIAVLLNGLRLREHRLAKHDVLTNTLSRASCIRKVKSTPECEDENSRNVLLLFDLDDFKSINDEYGHPTGDRALIEISKSVKTLLKSRDRIGRLGGEEFIVLLKECEELDIFDRVKAIHNRIADTRFTSESGVSLKITASMSYLSTPSSLHDFDALYSILDQALYQAKENGKNCIIDAYNEPIYLDPTAYASTQP
ncbi:GGDEF domain-containing protein [Vibrio sonorensis]|uniref:GGDEF domain-containing protein n=1 Tax=Vibrio sonorensis TaxID=1004316 RepID=UPI0008DB2C4C|nr:GGDEF domain-containing protein [Vibrio sonorensis]